MTLSHSQLITSSVSLSFSACAHTLTVLAAILKSKFPSLTNAPALLHSMHAQLLFKQGETSKNVSTLLARLQSADPGSPDIDEDNACQGWGHDLLMAGGLSPSNSLTSWQEVGSVATALKLMAASLKICQEAWMICWSALVGYAFSFSL